MAETTRQADKEKRAVRFRRLAMHALDTGVPGEHGNGMADGRGERIRTSDSCVPNAVLYQAELHPEADGGCRTDVRLPFLKTTGKIKKLRGQKLRSTAKAANCSKTEKKKKTSNAEIALFAVWISRCATSRV